jgi:hypothetical protein
MLTKKNIPNTNNINARVLTWQHPKISCVFHDTCHFIRNIFLQRWWNFWIQLKIICQQMLKQYFKIKEFVLVQSNSCPITITASVTFTSNPNAAITTSPIIEALSFSTNSNKALLARKHCLAVLLLLLLHPEILLFNAFSHSFKMKPFDLIAKKYL